MNEHLPQTETINPRTAGLDEMPAEDLARILASEQRSAVDAVVNVSDTLAIAIEHVTARLRDGGRLHYVGAGTSGRLGYLDASEMPPTFGTDPQLVCAHIAGGITAITRAVEGAEDDAEAGEREMRDHVSPHDAVVGVSASGGAPYVIGAMRAARAIGAWTLGIANSPGSPLPQACDLGIVLSTGPEPLTGSTRLKAGTSQKILLNTLSTAVMVRLGKVHDTLMVDVVATNKKLRKRALRLVMQLASVDETRAAELLAQASGSVKTAVVMERKHADAAAARALLQANGGSLRVSLT
jgi:N-acetylmuramic acid 6-phosphate etherase